MFCIDSAVEFLSRLIFCFCWRAAQLNTWYCWSENIFSRFRLAGVVI